MVSDCAIFVKLGSDGAESGQDFFQFSKGQSPTGKNEGIHQRINSQTGSSCILYKQEHHSGRVVAI